MSNTDNSTVYWANKEPEDLCSDILDKFTEYSQHLNMSGRMDYYRLAWAYYYRPRLTGASLNAAGQQGELTRFSINSFRNNLNHIEVMTVNQDVDFQCQATNTDVKSQATTIIGKNLLEYYIQDKKGARVFKGALKESLIYNEGFVRTQWDPSAGKVIGNNPNKAPIYEGDILYTYYAPFNVGRDFNRTMPNSDTWFVMRDFEDKFELAAKYAKMPTSQDPNQPVDPEEMKAYQDLKNRILSSKPEYGELTTLVVGNSRSLSKSNIIPVYTLLHDKTPIVPEGRMTIVLQNRTILFDGPLPYKSPQVRRIAPDEEDGTIFGYSVANDLLSIQQAKDIIFSTIITNQATFGVQNVLVPEGSNFSAPTLAGGMNFIPYNKDLGIPQALQLTKTASEIFNFVGVLDKQENVIAGVSSVNKGDPEASLKSGAALALVEAQAFSYNSALQESWANLLEDCGSDTIYTLQKYARVPHVAKIVGSNNQYLLTQFVGSDLDGIDRVTVSMGNPLTRTPSGKINMAEWYLSKGLIDDPSQLAAVVETGRLDSAIGGLQAQNFLINGENEGLRKGQKQRAIVTDNHPKHILNHMIVLSDPQLRQDPNNPIMQAALEHIQEHINMGGFPSYQAMLAAVHGQFAPQQAGGQQPPPGPPPGSPPPQSGNPGNPGNAANPTPHVVQQASGQHQPNLPKVPQGASPQSQQNQIRTRPTGV